MSNVLTITRERAEPTSLERLRRLSRGLSVLFQVLVGLALLWAVGGVLVTVFFASNVQVGPEGAYLTFPASHDISGTVLLSEQPWLARIAGIVDVIIATTPIMFGLWHLRGLFRLYARGIVFARDNARHLKQIGLWLLAYPFAKFGANMIFRAAGGTDLAWFSSTLIYALLLGAVVVVMAEVMAFGHEIEREREEFV